VLTNMARRYGLSPCGQRARAKVPFGNWKRLSVLSALDIEGFLATMSVEAATDGAAFAAYLEQVLLPVLREHKPDAVLVMDMCGRPRGSKRNLQDRCGAVSGADMCPASDAAVTGPGLVWESADQIQFNLARSRRLSIIWFFRSRLSTVAPYPPSDLPTPDGPAAVAVTLPRPEVCRPRLC
jgi:hypothetical protein